VSPATMYPLTVTTSLRYNKRTISIKKANDKKDYNRQFTYLPVSSSPMQKSTAVTPSQVQTFAGSPGIHIMHPYRYSVVQDMGHFGRGFISHQRIQSTNDHTKKQTYIPRRGARFPKALIPTYCFQNPKTHRSSILLE
jgi:hypothetical protein